MEKKLWDFMQEIRFRIFYLDLYADRSYKIDRHIKRFTAVASSTSVAVWAIWKKFPFVWSAVIAVSQVLSAVKDYLPYSTRLKNIEVLQKSLNLLFCKAEYNWYRVRTGELTEQQVNELLYELRKEYVELEPLASKGDVLLNQPNFIKKAEEQTRSYFVARFGSAILTAGENEFL